MQNQGNGFNYELVEDCAKAFSGASGLGCVVSDRKGKILEEFGFGCGSCDICAYAGRGKESCIQYQNYGMEEAESLGGKYIYYCPIGLTCFTSPILGEVHSVARITAGPFLMVDAQEFADCELADVTEEIRKKIIERLEKLPVLRPKKVNELSTLLFMAVGFINNASAANRLLDTQSTDAIKGQITPYIMQLKTEEEPPLYPFAKEKLLLKSIAANDKNTSQKLLNELMGHIFFSTGYDFKLVKARIMELLALISRAVVDAGADPELALSLCQESRENIEQQKGIDGLCYWLNSTINQYMDMVFQYASTRHASAIHHCTQYIEKHYYEKITLEQLAGMVYLSPNYLSRIFREETGLQFQAHLNKVRIEKAKALLKDSSLRLIDISEAVGYEDQSYFTKVFRRLMGVTPLQYRSHMCRNSV